MKMPGMTMSPRPSMECASLVVSVANWRGKRSLMGASKDLATVTITCGECRGGGGCI
jgi:hypothetical protein